MSNALIFSFIMVVLILGVARNIHINKSLTLIHEREELIYQVRKELREIGERIVVDNFDNLDKIVE